MGQPTAGLFFSGHLRCHQLVDDSNGGDAGAGSADGKLREWVSSCWLLLLLQESSGFHTLSSVFSSHSSGRLQPNTQLSGSASIVCAFLSLCWLHCLSVCVV